VTSLADICGHVTATTGTGTITLGAAVDSPALGKLRTFADAGISDGDVVSYSLVDLGTGHREVGRGTYTASGTTLTRTVLASTNSDAAIDLSGSAEVYVAVLTSDLAKVLGIETISGTTYTVVAADAGKVKRTTSADAVTITYDDGVLSARDVVTFRQGGAGVATVVSGTGTPTLNGDASTDGQHTALQIVAVSGSEIDIYGGVA
jgi:hypothetical protein